MEQISTIKEFNEAINQDGLRIVKFYGVWCAPCKMLTKTIENISPTLEDVHFYEVDVDDCEQELVERYGIQSVPVLLFFRDGLQVDKTLGSLPEKMLREKIEENKNK